MTHIDGKDDGNDGADQRPPAAKEEDAEGDEDGKNQSTGAKVTVRLGDMGGYNSLRLLLYNDHIVGLRGQSEGK